MMRRRVRVAAFAALLLAIGSGGPRLAAAAVLSDSDRSAVQGVIRQQLDAFRRDDAPGAFALASPGIQQMMIDPDHFLAIVRHAYQPVYAPRAVEFTTLSDDTGAVVQMVELIGPDGMAYTAVYSMEREDDGTWRISGCVLLESKRTGV